MKLRSAARVWIATALTVGAVACMAPAPVVAAGPNRSFFGMQAWTIPTAADINVMRRGGVGTVRVLFHGTMGASADSPRWAPYDALMAAASKRRVHVLPTLVGLPTRGTRVKRPRTRAQWRVWGRFVTAVAKRYGRGGTFWKDHSELKPIPFRAYQVWNEPNIPAYWRPANDARGYLRLVRRTRTRLRRVDRKALIVLAGLPDSRLGTPSRKYLQSIYARRGSRTLFDVVALHPYSSDARGVLSALKRARAMMDRRGDRRTRIWVTEVGWATGGPRSPFTTSRAGQAARIARTFRALIVARKRLRLGRVIMFGLQDRAYGATERPWWGPRVGLFGLSGRPKPAWRTFVRISGGRRGVRLGRVAPGFKASANG